MYFEIICISAIVCVLFLINRILKKEGKLKKTVTPISGLLLFLIFFQKLIQQGINTLNLAIIIPATFVLSYFIYKIIKVVQISKIN